MEYANNQKLKKKTIAAMLTTGISLVVFLVAIILAFSPVVKKDDVKAGELFGEILYVSIAVDKDDDDEVDELYDSAEDIAHMKNLDFKNIWESVMIYAENSGHVKEDEVPQYMYGFFSLALLLLSLILVILVAAIYMIQGIVEIITKQCDMEDACKRVGILTCLWGIAHGAAAFTTYLYEAEYGADAVSCGSGLKIMGISLIIVAAISVAASLLLVSERSKLKQLPGRVIAVIMFGMALWGMWSMTTDAFELEVETTTIDYEYDEKNSSKESEELSFVTVSPIAAYRLVNYNNVLSYGTLGDMFNEGETDDYEEALAKFGINIVIVVAVILVILLMYTMSLGNFAGGMCGKKTSLVSQITYSVIAIVCTVAVAILLAGGWGNMMKAIGDTYDAAVKDGFATYKIKGEAELKYETGFYLPIIFNILFIVLSVIKAVLDKNAKVQDSSMGQQVQAITQQSSVQPIYLQQPYAAQQPTVQQIDSQQPHITKQSQKAQIFCTACGTANSAENAFCMNCGNPLVKP